jgi:hypothetical protein
MRASDIMCRLRSQWLSGWAFARGLEAGGLEDRAEAIHTASSTSAKTNTTAL